MAPDAEIRGGGDEQFRVGIGGVRRVAGQTVDFALPGCRFPQDGVFRHRVPGFDRQRPQPAQERAGKLHTAVEQRNGLARPTRHAVTRHAEIVGGCSQHAREIRCVRIVAHRACAGVEPMMPRNGGRQAIFQLHMTAITDFINAGINERDLARLRGSVALVTVAAGERAVHVLTDELGVVRAVRIMAVRADGGLHRLAVMGGGEPGAARMTVETEAGLGGIQVRLPRLGANPQTLLSVAGRATVVDRGVHHFVTERRLDLRMATQTALHARSVGGSRWWLLWPSQTL